MDEVDALAAAGVKELETRRYLGGGSTAAKKDGESSGALCNYINDYRTDTNLLSMLARGLTLQWLEHHLGRSKVVMDARRRRSVLLSHETTMIEWGHLRAAIACLEAVSSVIRFTVQAEERSLCLFPFLGDILHSKKSGDSPLLYLRER